MFCSVSTLYVKYMILMAIFNMRLLTNYWFLFAAMFVCGLAVAGYFYFRDQKKAKAAMASKTDEAELQEEEEEEDKNPLEFQIAILFAILFVVFTIATHYTLQLFGTEGLRALSILVGATDITPFILNLYQAKYDIADSVIIMSTFQAIISSNIIKMVYGIFLSKRRVLKPLLAGFAVITIVNLALFMLI